MSCAIALVLLHLVHAVCPVHGAMWNACCLWLHKGQATTLGQSSWLCGSFTRLPMWYAGAAADDGDIELVGEVNEEQVPRLLLLVYHLDI